MKLPMLPLIKDLAELVKAIKPQIADDYVDEPGGIPYIQLTVGWDGKNWSYQTGSNDYTGGAYLYPIWSVVDVTRRCDSRELAREIRAQLIDQWED